MKKVHLLAQLQTEDSALDQGRQRSDEIEALLADQEELNRSTAEHSEIEVEHRSLLTEQRDLELEVEDLRGKLRELEKKLYSGRINNPKELRDMDAEANQYRGLISTREDRLLALFDDAEQVEERLRVSSARLDLVRQEREASVSSLREEQAGLQTGMARHQAERERLATQSDATSLRAYDGLRRTRAGLAVALVAQRTCQGCRVSLPTSKEQQARIAEELVFCQSCGRILHAEP